MASGRHKAPEVMGLNRRELILMPVGDTYSVNRGRVARRGISISRADLT